MPTKKEEQGLARFQTRAETSFRSLVKSVKSYASQAKASIQGSGDKVLAKRKRAVIADLEVDPQVKSYLNSFIGRVSLDEKMESKRKASMRLIASYLLGEIGLKEAVEKAHTQHTSAYKNIQVCKGQKSIKEVLPPELRAFLPDTIVVDIDSEGNIKEINDTFGNKTYTLKEKIQNQKKLIRKYNAIVKKVKADLRSEDERTRLSALITSLIMETGIRPGQRGNKVVEVDDEGNEVEVETFGATTLTTDHVEFMKDSFVKIKFKGKKGTQNVAEVADSQVMSMLKDYVDNAIEQGSEYIFVDESGRQYCYEDLRKYFAKNFKGFKITDFRKLRATQVVFDALKEERKDLLKRIKQFANLEAEELRQKVVDEIATTLEEAHKRAQVALSHEDSKTTKKSYINPEVILKFLSSAQLGQSLRQAILQGKTKLSFDPMVFIRESTKVASVVKLSGELNNPLTISELTEVLEGIFMVR